MSDKGDGPAVKVDFNFDEIGAEQFKPITFRLGGVDRVVNGMPRDLMREVQAEYKDVEENSPEELDMCAVQLEILTGSPRAEFIEIAGKDMRFLSMAIDGLMTKLTEQAEVRPKRKKRSRRRG